MTDLPQAFSINCTTDTGLTFSLDRIASGDLQDSASRRDLVIIKALLQEASLTVEMALMNAPILPTEGR